MIAANYGFQSRHRALHATVNHLATIIIAGLVLTACVKTYQPPDASESSALVKFKFAYGDASGVLPHDAFNDAIVVWVNMKDIIEDEDYKVYRKRYAGAASSRVAPPLEVTTQRFHTGKPLTFFVALGVKWQIMEFEQVCRAVTVRIGNRQRRERHCHYQYVTKNRAAECDTRVTFVPAPGQVYLIDYTSIETGMTCSVAAFQQEFKEDGTFSLKLIGSG